MGIGGRLFALGTLVVGGTILANLIIHPDGTEALGQAGQHLLATGEQGLLGQPPKYVGQPAHYGY